MSVSIFIDPFDRHGYEDRLFDVGSAKLAGDHLLAPYAYLRQWFEARGVPVHTADYLRSGHYLGEQNIYLSFGILSNYLALVGRPDVTLSAYFAFECPIVEPRIYAAIPRAARHFRRVFSWSDAETLERFCGARLHFERFFWPQSFDAVHEELWGRGDRGFLVMINANKLPRLYDAELYTARMDAVAFFGRTGEIDLFGKGWDAPTMRVGRTPVPAFLMRLYGEARRMFERVYVAPRLAAARRAWRGAAVSKSDTLSRYTFALCFENAALRGWVTEKLFDCLFAGTVPIYWGDPDIATKVPAEAFIDMRNFPGYQELGRFLRSLSPRQIQEFREAGRAFVGSPAFHRFSKQAFTEQIAAIVEADAGPGLLRPVPAVGEA